MKKDETKFIVGALYQFNHNSKRFWTDRFMLTDFQGMPSSYKMIQLTKNDMCMHISTVLYPPIGKYNWREKREIIYLFLCGEYLFRVPDEEIYCNQFSPLVNQQQQ